MKTQTKTTLILLVAFLTIISLFSVYVYTSVSKYSNEDFNRLLELRVLTAAQTELDHKKLEKINEANNAFFEKLSHEKDYFIPINDSVNLLYEAENIGVPHTFINKILTSGKADYSKQFVFFKGIKYTSNNLDYIVIASAENYFEMHHAAYLKRTLLFAIAAAFLFSLIIALYFSKYIFKPIHTITEKAREISSENLHLRIDIDNKSDELKELAITFNNMLDRIETSFETQNNFISNASHEFRTPLTAIIGEADVALSKIRKPEEYIESINIILDEAEKLDKKTKALLFLAQTGFNGKVQKFEKVRMDQLLWDVKETLEKISPKNKIHLDMSLLPENPLKLKIKGNEQLLHLALSNILSNASKYSDYQPVSVSLGATDNKVIIVIKDKGIGIPDSELKYIYDPFFRASNTKNYEGYGIGLPLSRNIIRIHSGELHVTSIENGGTTVQIILPIGNFEL
jgi:signal transduction histidine kinase